MIIYRRSSLTAPAEARLAGVLQLTFALWTLIEVARRVSMGSFPEEIAMIGISLLALAANDACLV